jgi:hypothetical protein
VVDANGEVDNDASLELIARTAVSHVEAGADAVCPSDMMDGRVGAIRELLPQTPIVAYSAKYASAFYGPFREAADCAPKFGDRAGYQMDPSNAREALRECVSRMSPRADMLMVKPALPHLDGCAVREQPCFRRRRSGEYDDQVGRRERRSRRAPAAPRALRRSARWRRRRDHVLGKGIRHLVRISTRSARPCAEAHPRRCQLLVCAMRGSGSTSRSSSARARRELETADGQR